MSTLGTDAAPPATAASETLDSQLVTETRNQIRQLVQEVTRLSESDVSLEEFYDGLITRVVSALAASGGVFWNIQDAAPQLAYRAGLEPDDLETLTGSRHLKLLLRTARSNQPLAAPPRSGFPDEQEAGNPTDQLLLLAPILLEREVVGIIEVLQRAGAGPTTQRGYLRFLSQMAELAGNFLRNHRLREFGERQAMWQKLDLFLTELHRSLSLDSTCYALVNEARQVVECDRVSLCLQRGSRAVVVAVSGLDNVDRRTQQATLLARLVDAVLPAREPFWNAGETSSLAPQIETPLQEYIDRSHTKALAILPLFGSGKELVGALVLEQMTDNRWGETYRQRAAAVVHFGQPALAHALEHDRIFLRPVWSWLGSWRQRLDASLKIKLAAAAGMIALLVACLALSPASFEVAARGKVLPSDRWEIFAPETGVVVDVPVRHGQQVAAGELLAQLESTEIEVQLTELLGRQRVAQEQLDTNQRTILDSGRGGRPRLGAGEESRLSGEVLQLRQTLAGIAKELELIREKQRRLTVTAPHDGEIVTWQVEQHLLRRPVQPGQTLMRLVDPDGPWELELYLPERRLLHVDAAAEESESLTVSFILSTHPGSEFEGQVVEIQRTAEVRGQEGNTVLVRVAFDRAELPALRSDTTVTAKIHCGTRSLGYVWFCDLIETVQTHVLFWL